MSALLLPAKPSFVALARPLYEWFVLPDTSFPYGLVIRFGT
jgi:hypothetical protein